MTLIEGRTGKWEITIGIETHAQISSNAKLFSSSSTEFGAEANTQVSYVDAALPGMLPVVNNACIDLAILTSLGLNLNVNLLSKFDRKHYFYPDLPQGYQISQFSHPIASEGKIRIDLEDGSEKWIRIERLHIEQDAGKNIHDAHAAFSLVDLNRSGVGLMEIVSYPDMHTAEEAKLYISKLRAIVRCLGTCDGNMEQGSLRADVNVSVACQGEELGTRCEIKNVNSIRFVGQAINYEARRQIEILEDGGEIEQQTRLFDPKTSTTRSMRGKEDAHDYRYFPCPDLPNIVLEQSRIDELRNSMPELPDARKDRYIRDFGISSVDAAILATDNDISWDFESLAKGRDPKVAARWMLGEMFAIKNRIGDVKTKEIMPVERLAQLIDLQTSGTISGRQGKEILEMMLESDKSADDLVEELGFKQQSDEGELTSIIDTIINDNPAQVEQVKAKPKALGWFVGQVMAKTKGSANPQIVNRILKSKLNL